MNYAALWCAGAFFVLGRLWTRLQADFRDARWWQMLTVRILVLWSWPVLAGSYGLDLLSQRWGWFGSWWRKVWRDGED